MDNFSLYKLPKDILVKMIASVRDEYETRVRNLEEFRKDHVCHICDEDFLFCSYYDCSNCDKGTCDNCGDNLGRLKRWHCINCCRCTSCNVELWQLDNSSYCDNCDALLCNICSSNKITCICGDVRSSCKSCLHKCRKSE